MQTPTREVRVEGFSNSDGPTEVLVRSAVLAVLDGEGAGQADFTVTSLSSQRMRVLNRRSFGKDRATDVIAFGLPHLGRIVGDVYVCPSVARRVVRELDVTEREEIIRLVVHGALHVLGHDHPQGENRYQSDMWKKQERYVSSVLGSSA